MPQSQLESIVEHYEQVLKALEEDSQENDSKVLETLIIRDSLQALVADKSQIKAETISKIYHLDEKLKGYFKSFPQGIKIESYRSILKPSTDAWWWFVESPHWWDKYDWLWDILTIVWLTASLTLTTNIATRFLGNGSGTGSFTGIATSLIGLISTGGVLTKPGQEAIERILNGLKIPKNLWQESKFVLATLIFGGLVFFHQSLPRIAIFYNEQGGQSSPPLFPHSLLLPSPSCTIQIIRSSKRRNCIDRQKNYLSRRTIEQRSLNTKQCYHFIVKCLIETWRQNACFE